MQFLQSEAYSNCIILAPDGEALTRASLKKINWYLSRNLAAIESEDPLTIRLKFEPIRRGDTNKNQNFIISEKENLCVCCGETRKLSRHHIVPRMFSKHLPYCRESLTHDVVLLCVNCHRLYEIEADRFKNELALLYDLQKRERFPTKSIVRKLSNTLLKHSDKIGFDRKNAMLDRIRKLTGKEDVDLVFLSKIPFGGDVLGKAIVEKIDIEELVLMWRHHFIKCMNPKFMPKHWDINMRWDE
jgi:hypothetical protein